MSGKIDWARGPYSMWGRLSEYTHIMNIWFAIHQEFRNSICAIVVAIFFGAVDGFLQGRSERVKP